MSEPIRKADRPFTYGDYLTWPDDERWEIIDGVAYAMSPAPSRRHQEILGEIFRQIANFLVDKPCRVYPAAFDVRLPEAGEADEQVRNVVQPDITVVCEPGRLGAPGRLGEPGRLGDPARLDARGCRGAPDLAVEILSPSSGARDLKLKLPLYERAGVREYWVVHPEERIVQVFRTGPQVAYGRPEAFGAEDRLRSTAVEGLEVELDRVFAER